MREWEGANIHFRKFEYGGDKMCSCFGCLVNCLSMLCIWKNFHTGKIYKM